MAHAPVLLGPAIDSLAVPAGGVVVDATVGSGGHAAQIARRLGPAGRLVAIDQDADALEQARTRVAGCRIDWVHGNFAETAAHLARLGIDRVDAVLADLGVSSMQLDRPERGFSFRCSGPLDMRMDPTAGEPAWRLLERISERELARLIWEFGEERYSRRIAQRIVEARREAPLRTTGELAEIVKRAVPKKPRPKGPSIDPATRTFQALRIAVNDELGALDAFLADLPNLVRPGGRAVVISFHSLEDRRVKEAFKSEPWRALTKKPLVADAAEVAANPRSRSAKLRAAERRAHPPDV